VKVAISMKGGSLEKGTPASIIIKANDESRESCQEKRGSKKASGRKRPGAFKREKQTEEINVQ